VSIVNKMSILGLFMATGLSLNNVSAADELTYELGVSREPFYQMAANEAQTVAAAATSGQQADSADLEQIKELKLDKEIAQLKKAIGRSSRKPLLKHLSVTGDGIGVTAFEHLGSEQYVAYQAFPAGDHVVEINGKDYDVNISEGDKEYVLLFNNRKPSRPQLTVFKRELLQYIDSPIK